MLALAGNPYRGHRVTVDTQELAAIVGTEVDHVTPQELADWIIAGATDYRLIDLRSPGRVRGVPHPDGGERARSPQLPDYGLARNEKIVLYSEGGIHSAQAWFLLKAEKYAGVYILFGGLEAWQDEVLYPVAPLHPTPQEAAVFERAGPGRPLLRRRPAGGRFDRRGAGAGPARGSRAGGDPGPAAPGPGRAGEEEGEAGRVLSRVSA